MKEFIKKVKEFFFPSETKVKVFGVGDPYINYNVTFNGRLNGEQMGVLLHKSIDNFAPNCKPVRLTLNTQVAMYTFSSNCMTARDLTLILNKTLEGTTPKIEVSSITITA